MFQLERCANPKFYSFHKDGHPEKSCLDWKRVAYLVWSRTFDMDNSMQEQSRDTDNGKDFSPDEASISGHVVNIYQCSQAALKTNTEKQTQKQNDHYNLKSKESPSIVGEVQEKMRLLGRFIHHPSQRRKQKASSRRECRKKVHPWAANSRVLRQTTRSPILPQKPQWVYPLWITTLWMAWRKLAQTSVCSS